MEILNKGRPSEISLKIDHQGASLKPTSKIRNPKSRKAQPVKYNVRAQCGGRELSLLGKFCWWNCFFQPDLMEYLRGVGPNSCLWSSMAMGQAPKYLFKRNLQYNNLFKKKTYSQFYWFILFYFTNI